MATMAKICGLKTDVALDAALDAGADYVGFVFFDKSPRNIDLANARRLAERARGRARVVALLVDASDARLDEVVAHVSPDMLQLHGSESPARVAAIKSRLGRAVMKAIKVETAVDAAEALTYAAVSDMILFDAKAPKGAPLPGGNGLAFDWSAIAGVTPRLAVPWMLSGGLTPESVAAAIQATKAPAVDVSSGVETAPGEKSPELIRRFLQAVKTANQNS